jgi:hypothetical protein
MNFPEESREGRGHMKTEGEAGRGSGCMASGAGVWPTRGVFGVTISTSGGGISSRLFLQRTCIGGPSAGQSDGGLATLWGGEAGSRRRRRLGVFESTTPLSRSARRALGWPCASDAGNKAAWALAVSRSTGGRYAAD